MIVRMEHCRKLRYCSRGVRNFFEKHGLDYTDFLKNGIPYQELYEASNGDGMVTALEEVLHGG